MWSVSRRFSPFAQIEESDKFHSLVGLIRIAHHWGPEYYDVDPFPPVRDEGLPAW